MTLSIGSSVVLRTEKIVSLIAYGDSNVEIVLNPISICFEFTDTASQQQFIELMKIAMTAEGEQAKIISKTLPKRDSSVQRKGRAPLPDKFSTRWK